LNYDLLPETIRPLAARHLVEGIHRYHGHLSTGIQTTHRAMLELSRSGHHDLAFQLLTNRTFPSWLYMIDNGATTIWERWDGYVRGRGFQDAGMNSFNHWAFGAVGEWMWRNIVGINPDDAYPGWKRFYVSPKPGGGVTWAKGRFESIRGTIVCEWRLDGGRFDLQVTIPPGTSATVFVPTTDPAALAESGRSVSAMRRTADCAVVEVTPGSYHFVAPMGR
jgi:alpha-L-rhamnosidase